MKPLNYNELLQHYQTKIDKVNFLVDKLQNKKIETLSPNEYGLIIVALHNLRKDYEKSIDDIEKHILLENINKTIND